MASLEKSVRLNKKQTYGCKSPKSKCMKTVVERHAKSAKKGKGATCTDKIKEIIIHLSSKLDALSIQEHSSQGELM